jgi:hypothetical protein
MKIIPDITVPPRRGPPTRASGCRAQKQATVKGDLWSR